MSFATIHTRCEVEAKYQKTTAPDYANQILSLCDVFDGKAAGKRAIISTRIRIEGEWFKETFEPRDEAEKLLRQRMAASAARNGLTPLFRQFVEKVARGEEVRPVDVPDVPADHPSQPEAEVQIPEMPVGSGIDSDEDEVDGETLAEKFARRETRGLLTVASVFDVPTQVEELDELPLFFRLVFVRIVSLDINYPKQVQSVIDERDEWPKAADYILNLLQELRDTTAKWEGLADGERISPPTKKFQSFRRAQTAIAWLVLKFKRMLDASDMGVGKTYGGALTTHIVPDAQIITVIVPNSVKAQTIKDYKAMYAPDPQVHVCNSIKEAHWSYRTGSPAFKLIVIDSVTQLSHDGDRHVHEFLQRVGHVDMVIIDEAHNVKSEEAQRSNAIKILTKDAKYVLLQTGTPLVTSLEDTRQVLSQIVKPGSEAWKRLRYDGGPKFKNNIGDATILGNTYESMTLRVLNAQELPEVEVIKRNADGLDEEANVGIYDELKGIYAGQPSLHKLVKAFLHHDLPLAVEMAKAEADKGGITMVNVGPCNGEVIPMVLKAMKWAGLRVAEFSGTTPQGLKPSEYRESVKKDVQNQRVDVVVCNEVAAEGVDGFQGDKDFDLPGRVTLFIDLIAHCTPSKRDQHYRRVFRNRGEASEIAPVRIVRIEGYFKAEDKEGNEHILSYAFYRNEKLRERQALFDYVIDGNMSEEMLGRDHKAPVLMKDTAEEARTELFGHLFPKEEEVA